MTARADFEAAAWAALARAGYRPPEGKHRKPVDTAFIDTILKAADRYATADDRHTADDQAEAARHRTQLEDALSQVRVAALKRTRSGAGA
jgi:nicotinamide mononucleotide (NMN) deamidase PncC